MTTSVVAQTALITVAQAYWTARIADPTYGTMYATTKFIPYYPLGAFFGPQIAIYRSGGNSQEQGLDTMKQWEDARFKVDVLGRNYPEAEQMCNAIWTAWETDYDYFIASSPAVIGKGYLKVNGGLKMLSLGGWSATNEERVSHAYFRRTADLTTTIGD